MSHIEGAHDRDLHNADGSHRTTPASTSGGVLDRFEKRVRRHVAEHRAMSPGAPVVFGASDATPAGALTTWEVTHATEAARLLEASSVKIASGRIYDQGAASQAFREAAQIEAILALVDAVDHLVEVVAELKGT